MRIRGVSDGVAHSPDTVDVVEAVETDSSLISWRVTLTDCVLLLVSSLGGVVIVKCEDVTGRVGGEEEGEEDEEEEDQDKDEEEEEEDKVSKGGVECVEDNRG